MGNSTDNICVITPSLPPAIGGLGDYCLQLWCHWPTGGGAESELKGDDGGPRPSWNFLVPAGAEASRQYFPEASISQFDLSESGLLEQLNAMSTSIVLLQYVGYGYDASGKPLWLPRALKAWLSAGADRHIVVMFHETWASGYPWHRVFWQASGQKRCAAELLSLASVAVTSNMATYRDLGSLGLPVPIHIAPLGPSFSIEDKHDKSWRQLLIIGKERSRLRAVQLHSDLIDRLARTKLIDRIVLAGECSNQDSDPSNLSIASRHLPVEIVSAYNFPSDSVPAEVLTSGLSLMHTESTCLLKSTSFQLAAQLGQVAIAIQELDPGQSVIPGKHYLAYRSGRVEAVLPVLSQPERIVEISNAVSELGATYLSWKEIGRSWETILKGVAAVK